MILIYPHCQQLQVQTAIFIWEKPVRASVKVRLEKLLRPRRARRARKSAVRNSLKPHPSPFFLRLRRPRDMRRTQAAHPCTSRARVGGGGAILISGNHLRLFPDFSLRMHLETSRSKSKGRLRSVSPPAEQFPWNVILEGATLSSGNYSRLFPASSLACT